MLNSSCLILRGNNKEMDDNITYLSEVTMIKCGTVEFSGERFNMLLKYYLI